MRHATRRSLFATLALFLPTIAFAQSVIHVAADAPAGGNGQSWATAYNNLAAALAAASAGTEVWVKAGTYVATTGFVVQSGVGLYGGFEGSETTRDQRDFQRHLTELTTEHRDTVIRLDGVSASTICDGLVVRDGGSLSFGSGSGLRVRGGAPTVRNCIFRDCVAGGERPGSANLSGGGAVYIYDTATPRFENCEFRDSRCYSDYEFLSGPRSGNGGAALVQSNSDAVFMGCRFEANTASSNTWGCVGGTRFRNPPGVGGAIFIDSATVRLIDCVLSNNRTANGEDAGSLGCRGPYPAGAGANGGAIYARESQVFARNCLFFANRAGDGGNGDPANLASGEHGGFAGAVMLTGGQSVFENCRFVNNRAGDGGRHGGFFPQGSGGAGGDVGAVLSTATNLTMIGCVLTDNRAGIGGAGFPPSVPDGEPGAIGAIHASNATILQCTIAGNTAHTGPAGLNLLSGTVVQCTIAGNTSLVGPAGLNLVSGSVHNSILYYNTVDGVQNLRAQAIVRTMTYTCIQGLTQNVGNGMIGTPPLFADPDGPDNIPGNADDDYSLAPTSRCIDAASNALLPPTLTLDLLGRPRRRDDPRTPDRGIGPAPIVDMGAYEFQPCVADMDDGTATGTPDGGVTIDDLLFFLDQYAQGLPRADLDDGSNTNTPDGGVTIDDLLYYLVRFEAGC